MILHCDPLATSCRPVLDLAAELSLPLQIEAVSLQRGEHQSPRFLAVNPYGQVPVLVDGDFILTESGAILRYLARGSRFDLRDAREAARADEATDWFKTGFAADFCTGYVYPQLIPAFGHPDPTIRADLLAMARERAARRFRILDAHMLGEGRPYLCGSSLSLADMVGAAMVELALLVSFNLAPYPNVAAWLARVTARPSYVSAVKALAPVI